jgi:2-dehydro-3-deoxyphosphogalactonate aldolase
MAPLTWRRCAPCCRAMWRSIPWGGVGAQDIARWLAAGAAGFGFGSELFRPDYSVAEIERRAKDLLRSLREARAQLE